MKKRLRAQPLQPARIVELRTFLDAFIEEHKIAHLALGVEMLHH